ncbi:hypothetical protein like AT5G20370 [Hibiscus trionum]|uniref:Uncharacterized protein n=1 Tax=Hibiscus trionum TaxID=183268 RepID=A0A9W7I4X2_HIBTR|nr:hypothetical protein like AT5G20370 [Hibiscus trionum]
MATVSTNTMSQSPTCLCSSTNHPGSFKCSPHRHLNHPPVPVPRRRTTAVRSSSNYKGLALIAKANSTKAVLLRALKSSRSSVVNVQRRRNFQPKPSRFYLLNSNRNGSGVSLS